jgi:ribosomal protein S17E
VKTLFTIPAKALARIYPQMSQMFTDEEKHLCSSVTSVDEISAPELRRKLAGTMTKAGRTRKHKATGGFPP